MRRHNYNSRVKLPQRNTVHIIVHNNTMDGYNLRIEIAKLIITTVFSLIATLGGAFIGAKATENVNKNNIINQSRLYIVQKRPYLNGGKAEYIQNHTILALSKNLNKNKIGNKKILYIENVSNNIAVNVLIFVKYNKGNACARLSEISPKERVYIYLGKYNLKKVTIQYESICGERIYTHLQNQNKHYMNQTTNVAEKGSFINYDHRFGNYSLFKVIDKRILPNYNNLQPLDLSKYKNMKIYNSAK